MGYNAFLSPPSLQLCLPLRIQIHVFVLLLPPPCTVATTLPWLKDNVFLRRSTSPCVGFYTKQAVSPTMLQRAPLTAAMIGNQKKPFMSDGGPTFQVTLHIVCTSWSTMCITAVSTVQVCSCGLCVQAVKRHKCVRMIFPLADVRDSLHFIVLAPTRRPLVRLGIGQEGQEVMKDRTLTPIRM